jgi:hypothetical protein
MVVGKEQSPPERQIPDLKDLDITKIVTETYEDGKKKGTFTDALKGKTLYLDRELFKQSAEKFGKLNIKKLTGTVVSSNPEHAACNILYYKNFTKKVFSLTDVPDQTARAITTLGEALLSNIDDATIYKWGSDYRVEDVSLNYPISTEVDKFFSELGYLLHMYEDIDYNSTIITSFSPLTRYIFGYVYQTLEREHSPKTLNITPELYTELEKITTLKSVSSTIKGLVFLTSIIYFILKEEKGSFVDFLQFLRKEKSVNLSRINKPLSSLKGQRFNLLHEWNVVCSNYEMSILLGDDWSDLMKRQRKCFDEFRRGKDKIKDLQKIEDEIKNIVGPANVIVYTRQKKLHEYVKHLRETSKGDKSIAGKARTMLPKKAEWRNYCIDKDDKASLCEITIPLMEEGYIKSEQELSPVIVRGKAERSVQTLILTSKSYELEPWYLRVVADAQNESEADRKSAALEILQTLESKTYID